MAARSLWRRVRQHFGISAPRMAVRTHLSWPWRIGAGLAVLGIVGGMWWWGFDFGQIFGGFNRKVVDAKLASLEAEVAQTRTEIAQARGEVSQLRGKTSRLESELAMSQGTRAVLSRQVTELQTENSQLKEDLGFLQKLVADASRQEGVTIQRLAAARDHGDEIRFSMLVVRGGSSTSEFDGNLKLQATLYQPGKDAAGSLQPVTLTLPEEQPDTASALKLKFKYYQRVEGSFRVPQGATLRSLTARAFETGQSKPKATQSLNLP